VEQGSQTVTKPKRRRRPTGRRADVNHHLYQRSDRQGTIYLEIVLGGQQRRASMQTADWEVARAKRDAWIADWLAKNPVGGTATVPAPDSRLTVGVAADLAIQAWERGEGKRKATTIEDRVLALRPARPAGMTFPARPAGPLRRAFGDLLLTDLTVERVERWWLDEIVGKGLAEQTGRNRLAALGAVWKWARAHQRLDRRHPDPVRAFQDRLREENEGTAASRRRSGENIKPFRPGEIEAFLAASRASGRPAYAILDLLLLDAGLRLGEGLALEWADVTWGAGPDDRRRSLWISKSLSRGRHATDTKSGRVALSKRLWFALRERHAATDGQGRIAPVRPSTYRRMHFAGVCRAAGIGSRDPKDLRDTFASQLLTSGVPLVVISRQLGHANQAVTEKHYARYVPEDDLYREPVRLLDGEVPADLLARLSPTARPHRPSEMNAAQGADSPDPSLN
jgi:integrase